MISMGSGWPMDVSENTLDNVSARFAANSIFCEMATGDLLPTFHNNMKNNYGVPNS